MDDLASRRAEARALNVRTLAASAKCAVGICEEFRLDGRSVRLDGKPSSLYAVVGDSKALASSLRDKLEFLRIELNDSPVKRVLEDARLISAFQDIVEQMASWGQAMVVTLADIKTAGKFLGEIRLGPQRKAHPRVADHGNLLAAAYRLELGPGTGRSVGVDSDAWRFGYHVDEKQARRSHNYRVTSHHTSFGRHYGHRCTSLARTGEAYWDDHQLGRRPIELSRPQREGSQLRYYDCMQLTARVFDYSTLGEGEWDPETRHWAAAIDAHRVECETIVMSGFSCRMSANVRQTVGVDRAIDDALCTR